MQEAATLCGQPVLLPPFFLLLILFQWQVRNIEDMQEAAQLIMKQLRPKCVLIKGGHLYDEPANATAASNGNNNTRY
jgi:hydroxymethylpyrimidine/phosphomethylpyrimidine kinase